MPQTVKDTTSNLMMINLQRNKTNKLLEKKNINLPKLTQGKIENLPGPITIMRNWVSSPTS